MIQHVGCLESFFTCWIKQLGVPSGTHFGALRLPLLRRGSDDSAHQSLGGLSSGPRILQMSTQSTGSPSSHLLVSSWYLHIELDFGCGTCAANGSNLRCSIVSQMCWGQNTGHFARTCFPILIARAVLVLLSKCNWWPRCALVGCKCLIVHDMVLFIFMNPKTTQRAAMRCPAGKDDKDSA